MERVRPFPDATEFEKNAENIREASAEMTARIARFEEYLSRISGRVETHHYFKHPELHEEGEELLLKLHREGKKWILSIGEYSAVTQAQHDDYCVDFKPLVEASLKFKMAAMDQFPSFLEAVQKSQVELHKRLTRANAEFDKFEAHLMRTGGK